MNNADDAAGVHRDEAIVARQAAGGARSIVAVVLTTALQAAAAGAAFALTETAVVLATGSYVPWSILVSMILFWTLAGAVLGAAASIVLLPVELFRRGFVRVVAPAILAAAAAACAALSVRVGITDGLPRGAEMALDTRVILAWAAAVGACAWFLCARRAWRPAHVTAVVLAGVSVSMTAAWVAPRTVSAYALFAGPPVFACIAGIAIEHVRAARRSAAAGVVVAVAACAVVVAVIVLGQRPEATIDEEYDQGAVASAMLAGKPNVILITLDTTRGDHMSVWGYPYPTTPNLEKLAADCRLFPNAHSVSSWTLPSHASMLTGKYSREHGARAVTDGGVQSMERGVLSGAPLAPSQVTLATYLRSRATTPPGSWPITPGSGRQFGLNQGFKFYQDTPRYMIFKDGDSFAYNVAAGAIDRAFGLNRKFLEAPWSAEDMTGFAGEWLAKHKEEPFFLFLNYMDAHAPYAPPPPYDKLHEGVKFNNVVANHRLWQRYYEKYNAGAASLDDGLLRQIVNQYDGEIAYMDHWLGKLVDRLKEEGSTTIVS